MSDHISKASVCEILADIYPTDGERVVPIERIDKAYEEIIQLHDNFCPNCGADLKTKETDYDYERAVEQLEHDILYESTFNQDDGSM